MSFLDSVGDALSSGDFLSSAFGTIATTAAGILGAERQQDQLDAQYAREDERYAQELAAAREKTALELRLQALKALYGGGGGGGGGPFTGITQAQKVAAVQGQGELQQTAVRDALTGMQNAYGLGVRY